MLLPTALDIKPIKTFSRIGLSTGVDQNRMWWWYKMKDVWTGTDVFYYFRCAQEVQASDDSAFATKYWWSRIGATLLRLNIQPLVRNRVPRSRKRMANRNRGRHGAVLSDLSLSSPSLLIVDVVLVDASLRFHQILHPTQVPCSPANRTTLDAAT